MFLYRKQAKTGGGILFFEIQNGLWLRSAQLYLHLGTLKSLSKALQMPEEFEHCPFWDVSASHMHQYLGRISSGLFKAYILKICWLQLPLILESSHRSSFSATTETRLKIILEAAYSIISSCSIFFWKCGYWPPKDSRKVVWGRVCASTSITAGTAFLFLSSLLYSNSECKDVNAQETEDPKGPY